MFRSTLGAVITLLIIMGTTAFADGNCERTKVAGAYLRHLQNGDDIYDQLVLTSDGVAYWYQSTAFDFFLTTGSHIPAIGSWKCIDDKTLVVTTIAVEYGPVPGDLAKQNSARLTQKISVVDSNTLKPLVRVFKRFALSDDPLNPNSVPLSSTTTTFATPYKRIKPLKSDVP